MPALDISVKGKGIKLIIFPSSVYKVYKALKIEIIHAASEIMYNVHSTLTTASSSNGICLYQSR